MPPRADLLAQLGPDERRQHHAGAQADDGRVDAGDVVVAPRARHGHQHDRDADDDEPGEPWHVGRARDRDVGDVVVVRRDGREGAAPQADAQAEESPQRRRRPPGGDPARRTTAAASAEPASSHTASRRRRSDQPAVNPAGMAASTRAAAIHCRVAGPRPVLPPIPRPSASALLSPASLAPLDAANRDRRWSLV